MVCVLVLLGAPAVHAATTVSVRIEIPGQTLVPKKTVTLPSTPVAPPGAPDGQTCPGNSVVGAISAATGNDWSGTWSDTDGWSVDSIKGFLATPAQSREWWIYVDTAYLNDAPCHKELTDGVPLILIPKCTGSSGNCFLGEPLTLTAPANGSPGGILTVTVWELQTVLDPGGHGVTTLSVAENATVTSPDGSAKTNYLGVARIPVTARGDNTLTATKPTDASDRSNVCITDGQDGYCGTTPAPPVPFDPYAFCQTTGFDGYCGSPDHVPPVGHVNQPQPDQKFTRAAAPKLLKGTVDFDPSQINSVNLRLMRKTTVTRYRIKKKRVTVKRKVHGRTVRKRVVKTVRKPYKTQGCFSWSVSTSTWKALKKCDASTAQAFKADGADEWSFEFLTALPAGSYTLDALAKDEAGNVDNAMELGRNRIAFTVT